MIVAVDGPAGAGKSTVARGLAARLGIGYLNTGAMYRAVALLALELGVDTADGGALARLAAGHDIKLAHTAAGDIVLVDGRDVTEAVRGTAVTDVVSHVAAHPPVREAMVRLQRELLADGDWVADGRDIGTVVCPDADVKVFLTATAQERARRRHAELVAEGAHPEPAQVLRQIERRDGLDAARADSPMMVAPGAVVIDTTGIPVDAVIDRIESLVRSTRP